MVFFYSLSLYLSLLSSLFELELELAVFELSQKNSLLLFFLDFLFHGSLIAWCCYTGCMMPRLLQTLASVGHRNGVNRHVFACFWSVVR